LLSHRPSRWYIPYEADDPFGLPEELEQVKAVLLGRLDDNSGERTHGTTGQLGARPVNEALREESAVDLEEGRARNYRRRSADAGAEAGVVDGGTDRVERSGIEYGQQSRSAPLAYLDAIGQPLWKRATHPLLAELYVMIFLWPVVQIGLWQLGGSHPEHGLLDIVVGNICFIAASLAFGLVRDCLHREEPPCVPVVSSDRLDGAGRHEQCWGEWPLYNLAAHTRLRRSSGPIPSPTPFAGPAPRWNTTSERLTSIRSTSAIGLTTFASS